MKNCSKILAATGRVHLRKTHNTLCIKSRGLGIYLRTPVRRNSFAVKSTKNDENIPIKCAADETLSKKTKKVGDAPICDEMAVSLAKSVKIGRKKPQKTQNDFKVFWEKIFVSN